MKLISWNVNGLRACQGKGFSDTFRQLDADFFCLQETKMQEGQLDLQFEGYTSYWNYADKKGYSGTAIFSRHQPLSVTYGIGIDEHDHEGRVITLETEQFFLVCCYTPNSQDGLKRLDYRMQWEDDFRAYLLSLDQRKPVILCGDLNVAHTEIDLKRQHRQLGCRRLSFASADLLGEKLGLVQGSVTPLGVLNDSSHEVVVFFGQELEHERFDCHPLVNTATMFVEMDDIAPLLRDFGATVVFCDTTCQTGPAADVAEPGPRW